MKPEKTAQRRHHKPAGEDGARWKMEEVSSSPPSSPQCKPPGPRSLSSGSDPHYGTFNGVSSDTMQAEKHPAISPGRVYAAIVVLCYINLLNYMERSTIAGVLLNIQQYFGINDSTAALLHTVYIFSFLVLAPVFGYLGDRYNRKYIMIGGVVVWIGSTAASSLVTKSHFWFLILMRVLVGVGESSFTTIAPSIICDLFNGVQRSVVLCVYYVLITAGSGLGYAVAAGVATLSGDWRWALRITPILVFVGLVLLFFLCPNPPRGAAETHGNGVEEKSSYLEDLKYLLTNKSYVLLCLGMAATCFTIGCLAFWIPVFLSRAQVFQGLQLPCTREPCNPTDSYAFGAVTVVTGIVGGCLGTGLSRWLRDKVPNVGPLICGTSLMGAAPCLLTTIFVASRSIPSTYVFISFVIMLVTLSLPLTADLMMGTVIPSKRSTAQGLQITFCHFLGDAGSPFFVGLISDSIRNSKPRNQSWNFHSLQYGLLISVFTVVLAGVFYLLTALYIIEDRNAVLQFVEGSVPPGQNSTFEPPQELSY